MDKYCELLNKLQLLWCRTCAVLVLQTNCLTERSLGAGKSTMQCNLAQPLGQDVCVDYQLSLSVIHHQVAERLLMNTSLEMATNNTQYHQLWAFSKD